MKDLATVIRRAIERSGSSDYRIAKLTGIPQPTITRFRNGADSKLSTASVLLDFFGLEVIPKRRAKR